MDKAKTRQMSEGQTQFGYLENGGAQGQAQSSPKTAAETIGPPKSVGEYVSEEDYNKQAGMISRQLELNKKSTDAYAGMLQIYQGNTDPEAVRMYEQAQAGYNRNLKLQSELRGMMDTLQGNRDYSAQAEETEKSDKFFGTDVDAARDFAEKAIKLTDENNKEYAAIMTVDWVPENRNGELLLVPKYTYSDILEGEHNHVISIALAGLLIKTDGRKYLLHTHPKSSFYEGDVRKQDVPDLFSGTPYNLFDMGDASIPTLAGADWYELPQIINNVLQNATLRSIGVSGYDGIYLCSPNGKLYYYEGTGEGEYQANTKDELENKIYNNPVAGEFPKIYGYKDYDTGTIYPD